MSKLEEKRISSEYKYCGKVINVRVDQARIPNGNMTLREVVEHPGGVGIALEDDEGRFFMVTQYRYAQEQIMLEYPAGKKEKGEDPLTTAKREIVEETGYEGRDFVYLGNMVPTPAYDTEVIELYYARTGKYIGQHLDDDESIRLSRLTLDEITEKIVKGEINDAKTMGMTFLIREYKARHGE
jgi:ADP-ribose pyrophosphatase